MTDLNLKFEIDSLNNNDLNLNDNISTNCIDINIKKKVEKYKKDQCDRCKQIKNIRALVSR